MLAKEFILCLLLGMCVYFNLCVCVCFLVSTSGKYFLIALQGEKKTANTPSSI